MGICSYENKNIKFRKISIKMKQAEEKALFCLFHTIHLYNNAALYS